MTASVTAISLDALRRQLAAVVDVERPAAPGLATGLAALDQLLPGSGLPRGRLTEVVGARSSGCTTLLRQMVVATRREGGWVAWVDAARTLAPQDWTADGGATTDGGGDGGHGRDRMWGGAPLWVVRPPSAARAAWCADVLLRSGAFTLVVLDGAPMLSRATAVRLTRLARDANAALVVLGDDRGGTMMGGAVRLRVERRQARRPDTPGGSGVRSLHVREGSPDPPVPSTSHALRDPRPPGAWRMQVTIEKGGSHQSVEVNCEVGVARRLCAHPEVPDRRGVAATGGVAGTVDRGGGATGGAVVVPSRSSPDARRGRGVRRRV